MFCIVEICPPGKTAWQQVVYTIIPQCRWNDIEQSLCLIPHTTGRTPKDIWTAGTKTPVKVYDGHQKTTGRELCTRGSLGRRVICQSSTGDAHPHRGRGKCESVLLEALECDWMYVQFRVEQLEPIHSVVSRVHSTGVSYSPLSLY